MSKLPLHLFDRDPAVTAPTGGFTLKDDPTDEKEVDPPPQPITQPTGG